ncbi:MULTISPECIES: TAXI family TRAP transporter solute-binding subunit [unclassified Simplicispira]|uniref:TAXI family TRAP transporter solute-binding subunit n=1 Tax=unclassified Simplicispira TaxID=2630407 RepID=UPI000D5CE046|nr:MULTISPECIES: TAXI family TRAP transporter solute-binding subunit [unclassified Simplicispira]PVY55846.1 TRAP transporter TAXI family solute receptor [Simplicispira sp. 125]REG16789.1 TRAP transporter TAXI family solute receptor [Simplicispira sp. 110]
MPQAFRSTLLSLRDMLVSAGPLALLAVGLLALAYWWLNPTPPKYVVLATGAEQSAYAEFGQRYQKALAAQGIEVRLLPSEGSLANLQLLREGRADLAFVQGGTAVLEAEDHDQLRSLGSLFVEPLWLFYRTQAVRHSTPAGRLDALPQLRGLRVNVGTEGSGVPILVDKLLDANHMLASDLRLSRLEQTPATVAFLDGKIDVLVFASAPESPMVQMLLQTPGVRLMDFPQNEAYGRRFPFLTPVTLPRGVVDLAGNVPVHDVRLVASTTALLTRTDTHPALLQLFAQHAQTLHSGAGWFNRAREFPSTRHSELEIAPEADRAINEPVPLLQRYLPFWLANLVQRMWLVLGILIAVMLPLSRVVPPLYQLRVRSRVFRWYGRLREIENDMVSGQAPSCDLTQALDALEAQVLKVSVPLAYADELYALRNHIQMVRGRLAR